MIEGGPPLHVVDVWSPGALLTGVRVDVQSFRPGGVRQVESPGVSFFHGGVEISPRPWRNFFGCRSSSA